jgi:NTP pyrophosphatase (non-canonical NTP hydrolase)
MALTAEVGELVELLQWLTDEQSRKASADPKLAAALADELADVLIYTVRLASVAGVDLDAAVLSKLERNESKYPIEQAYGKSDKYDKL